MGERERRGGVRKGARARTRTWDARNATVLYVVLPTRLFVVVPLMSHALIYRSPYVSGP